MELYQLRYFAKAAKYENISMAAQELHVSQPSISKAIKALEKDLQVELMCKNGKYCALTHQGRLLQARIGPILAELNEIPKEIIREESSQTLRLNVLSAGLLMPEIVRKFREENPRIFFKLIERRESISWDICIRSTLPEIFFNSARKLLDEKLLLACRKDSNLAEKEIIALNDLEKEEFIVLRQGGSIRTIMDKKFKELGFIPNIKFRCDNFYMMKRMVSEGLGVTIWPQYSWRERLNEEENEVCLKPIDISDFYRTIYLIYQKDVKITTEMEKFADFTKKYFDNAG